MVNRAPHILNGQLSTMPEFEVTFDGGARTVEGVKVAGAGAVLWGPADVNRQRVRLLRIAIALPGEQHAPVAEAWGLRAALQLLLEARVPRKLRTAIIAGDNLAVVRYGASLGKLAKPHMHAIIDEPLNASIGQGWQKDWIPIRRRFNKEADQIATFAVMQARKLLDRNITAPTKIVIPNDADLDNMT